MMAPEIEPRIFQGVDPDIDREFHLTEYANGDRVLISRIAGSTWETWSPPITLSPEPIAQVRP